MALIDIILGPIERLFNAIFGGTVVGRLVTKIRDGITHILTLVERITHLVDSVKSEITEFSHWKEDIKFKSRVINVPAAVEHTQDLIQGFRASWASLQDLVTRFRDAVRGGNPQAEAEEMAGEFAEVENIGSRLLSKLPKLAKGLEKMLGVVTLIVDAVITWSGIVDDLQTIVDEITRVREEFERLESLFLSQKNPRRTVKIEGGGSMKIRVGNLHS